MSEQQSSLGLGNRTFRVGILAGAAGTLLSMFVIRNTYRLFTRRTLGATSNASNAAAAASEASAKDRGIVLRQPLPGKSAADRAPASEVLKPGRVAIITGAGSGIGLAAAKRFAKLGMKVVLADIDAEDLKHAQYECVLAASGNEKNVECIVADVSKIDDVAKVQSVAYEKFGEDVAILFNNAGIGGGSGPTTRLDRWKQVLDVNLWGVVHGVQTFVPNMVKQNTPAIVINTGSKQGITTPPGDTAYNVSKSGVKILTEGLEYELRNTANCKVAAYLLIPGWVNTSIKLKELRRIAEQDGKPFHVADVSFHEKKPASGAWMPDQVIDKLLEALRSGGPFYVICPDYELSNEKFRVAIQWAADDLIQERVPLSRWADEYKEDWIHLTKNIK
jgi:NAD(P)-dependent dehydrogenase (short-subunit alcohol dehydrogenase family)